jgi:hypothetical protein
MLLTSFAAVPKKDKPELERQLSNDKTAYYKLSHINGRSVPRLYGEYEWFGGRARGLSDEVGPYRISKSSHRCRS